MAKTEFDYARAWLETARPAYDVLPADVRQLFVDTARIAKDLHQDQTCAMIWPTETTMATVDGADRFRERFDKIPAEWLSIAAQIIHNLGHWQPSKDDRPKDSALPHAEQAAIASGAHWKFSHYADQSLRVRLGMPERGNSGSGLRLAVHEGAIRVCYSSRDTWTWVEVAPATEGGKAYALTVADKIRASYSDIPDRQHHKRDNAACAVIEAIKKTARTPEGGFPDNWRPHVGAGETYMAEPGRTLTPEIRAPKLAQKAADMPAKVEAQLAKHAAQERIELAGRVWWLEHGIDDENLIYYTHTKTFCFGWRDPIGPDMLSAILEHASEFPYPYEIKVGRCELYPQGAKLAGGKG